MPSSTDKNIHDSVINTKYPEQGKPYLFVKIRYLYNIVIVFKHSISNEIYDNLCN